MTVITLSKAIPNILISGGPSLDTHFSSGTFTEVARQLLFESVFMFPQLRVPVELVSSTVPVKN